MQVTRTSPLSGKSHTLDLPVTADQLTRYDRREGLVQDIFPELSAEHREFIMTGITPEEWNAIFGEEEE